MIRINHSIDGQLMFQAIGITANRQLTCVRHAILMYFQRSKDYFYRTNPIQNSNDECERDLLFSMHMLHTEHLLSRSV